MIILAIVAITSPLTFGIALAAIATLIAALIVAFTFSVTIIALVMSLAVAAIALIITGFASLSSSILAGLFYLGIGLVLLGLFIIITPLIYQLISWLGQLTVQLAKNVYAKFPDKEKINNEKNA